MSESPARGAALAEVRRQAALAAIEQEHRERLDMCAGARRLADEMHDGGFETLGEMMAARSGEAPS